MSLLVVGANGLLGSTFVSTAHERSVGVRGTYHSTRPDFDIPLTQFDLRDHDKFDEILDRHDPDAVVNCAALTDVDGCEETPELAHEVNGAAPGAMATACADEGIAFVHVSTDYVFDGTERDPYAEEATPNPLQVYGESKLAGERAVRRAPGDALLSRLSFVWGVHGATGTLTGFPAWVRDQFQSGEEVSLFTDQWVTPTRAGQAAATILDLLDVGATGCYHVASRSCVTPYAFGEQLAGTLGHGTNALVEGSTDDVDRPAPRPTYTCLDTGAVASTLGRPQPTVHDDLAAVEYVR